MTVEDEPVQPCFHSVFTANCPRCCQKYPDLAAGPPHNDYGESGSCTRCGVIHAKPQDEPSLLTAKDVAMKLANVGGIDRWIAILDQWLKSYTDRWKEEEKIWHEDEPSREAWEEFIVKNMCSLCGQAGVIDSRGICTPAGFECGGLHYCICPNGRALKRGKADKQAWLAQARLSTEGIPYGDSIASQDGMKLNKRRCEICKKEEGPGVECVSPFTFALRQIGINSGGYAHPKCLKRAQKAFGSNEKPLAAKLTPSSIERAARRIAEGIVDKLRLSGTPVLPDTHEALIFWAKGIMRSELQHPEPAKEQP